MVYIVEQKKGKTYSSYSKILRPDQMKSALSPLAWKILEFLAEKPMYPKELAQTLKMHEQKIYYHIRNLEKSGIIKREREEMKQGAIAKYYVPTGLAFSILLKELEPTQKIQQINSVCEKYLNPFVKNGKFNAIIVVGSPEPHGPTNVKARDVVNLSNISLFLGSFLNYIPIDCVKLDTEMRTNDLKKNLIIIGGPGVNAIAARVNKNLPIRLKRIKEGSTFYSKIHSNISKKDYERESCGLIVKTKNPFDKKKQILVIAGRRLFGTEAAILSFLKKFDDLCKGNSHNSNYFANIVEGIDNDNDGKVDSVRILE